MTGPTAPEHGAIDQRLQPIIAAATSDLAARLGVTSGDVAVLRAVAVVWPDTSLGCPRSGMEYRQVPSDGAIIELAAGSRVYRYHSGGSRPPFLCELPELEDGARSRSHP